MREKNTLATLHFFARLIALTGLLAAGVGAILWLAVDGAEIQFVGKIMLIAGAALVAIDLLAEIGSIFRATVSKRGAVGFNVLVQVVLATILLIGVNVFSFLYSKRIDCTRERIFTLPEKIRDDLRHLSGETDIVVYHRHTAFGQTGDVKQDNYDAAAERKIVEQVKDLVDQFRELGARFRVEMLDTQEQDYQDKLVRLGGKSQALAKAIKEAPENSIFVYARAKGKAQETNGTDEPVEYIQRLSFHDIYQLDKEASQTADYGNGNLVLNYQGVGPFARKILNIEEKKPRVALAVVHELLSFTDPRQDQLTMAAAGKLLTAAGFETRDLILKTGWGERTPEPTVLTFDMSRFKGLEDQRLEAEANVKAITKEIEELNADLKLWKLPLPELNNKLVIILTDDGARLMERADLDKLKKSGTPFKLFPIDEKTRSRQVQRMETALALNDLGLQRERADLDGVLKEQKDLNVEDISEVDRITDLQAKMNRQLADCDLLILPRHTILDLPHGEAISSWVHQLDEAQLSAIKAFMRAGKPVLFCLGPTNEGRRDPGEPPDSLERSLTDLGVQLPKQTIIFNAESKSFGERKGGLLILGTQAEVPPVEFEWALGAGLPPILYSTDGNFLPIKQHPIDISLQLASRSVGHLPSLDLRLRAPRPVYFKPGKMEVDPTLFMSARESWNDNQPFATKERTPRFELPKRDDRDNGTVRERRHGPFPLAAAFEADIPASWGKGPSDGKPVKVRMAVIGHGGVFIGKSLSVIQQKLLLDTCNWLLGRDDLLANREKTWQFPRVDVSDPNLREVGASTVALMGSPYGSLLAASTLYPGRISDTRRQLWLWGAGLGPPLLFVYLGMTMWLIRRTR